jgi:hypothetical protein
MVMVTVHSKKRDYIDVSWITDFDGTVYKLSSGSPEEPENKSLLCMSIQVVGYDEIVSSLGGAEFLQDTCYAKYLRDVEAGDGTRKFNVTVLANVDELPEEQWESFAYDWACMKRNLLGFPLARALEGLVDESKALTTDVVINYRPEESIYVCPDQGKVTVVYALSFPDPNDMEIAKVFLEEFTVAKRQRELGSSPSVNFGPTPPGELSGFHLEPSDAIVGFLSLSKSTASLLLPAAHVWPPHQGPPGHPCDRTICHLLSHSCAPVHHPQRSRSFTCGTQRCCPKQLTCCSASGATCTTTSSAAKGTCIRVCESAWTNS